MLDLTTLPYLRNTSLKWLAKGYDQNPATKQHSKKRLLSTIKLYKEVTSNIPSCTNPCNPPHTVAITVARISEILFDSTQSLAKMFQQILEKDFSLHYLNIPPPKQQIP